MSGEYEVKLNDRSIPKRKQYVERSSEEDAAVAIRIAMQAANATQAAQEADNA
jgi:hypothetical protein